MTENQGASEPVWHASEDEFGVVFFYNHDGRKMIADSSEALAYLEALEQRLADVEREMRAKAALADEILAGPQTTIAGGIFGHPVCRWCGLPGGAHEDNCPKARYDALNPTKEAGS